jgi:hypothetical protein
MGASGSPRIGDPIEVEIVPCNLSSVKFSGSEEDEKEATIPPIIAITITPIMAPFLFILR